MADQVTKQYTAEFKQQLVERYLQGGTTLKAIAQEAHISRDTLSGWVKAHQKAHPTLVQKTKAPKKAKAKAPVSKAPKAEKQFAPENEIIADLRKQLALVTEERDILKRALRILSV